MKSYLHNSAKKPLFFIIGVAVMVGCSTVPIKPTSISPGDYEYTKQYVSWLIQKEMKRNNVTGLSIALVDDQRVVWAQGFGYADTANKVPATPETLYRVGSISKLFTATAVMQLAEEGKIDIDQPLQTYLPEFSVKTRFPDAGPITPRSIMTHHSGLPSNHEKGMWSKNPEPFTTDVTYLKDEYTAYPPNYIFSYSNLAVTILGPVIEKVTDRDFVSYMDDALLRPMNMTHSSFAPGPDLKPFLSKGYRDGKEIEEAGLRDVPAGALQSNVLESEPVHADAIRPRSVRRASDYQARDACRDAAAPECRRALGLQLSHRTRLGAQRLGKYRHQERRAGCAPQRCNAPVPQ